MSTRTTGLTRFLLFFVAAWFLSVSACSFRRDEGIQYFGDGTLLILGVFGHLAGLLMVLVYGGLALAPRSIACSRVGMAAVVSGTVAAMFLYWLYFQSLSFAMTLREA